MINWKNFLPKQGLHKAILVLGGEKPDKNLFCLNLPIIAVDGGAVQLKKLCIKPKVVIGDLDSCPPDFFPEIPRLYRPDQNYCDFEKALIYLEEERLQPVIITGLYGGFMDHSMNNLKIFTDLSSDNIFYNKNEVGFTVEGKIEMDLIKDVKLSIFALPSAKLTTKGLKWDLNEESLDFFGRNSAFNRSTGKQVIIDVLEGKVLIILHRHFIKDAGL